MIPWLRGPHDPLPETQRALPPHSDAPGLLAAGGELTPQRLMEAYSRGIFPWYSEGQPILWWSPDPRMVLLTENFRISRSLRKTLLRFVRTRGCDVHVDHAFARVIDACAQSPRDGQAGTWIVPEMIDAYSELHRLGIAHSFETWVDGELVGGLYGVSLGRTFFGESMFSRRTDASKIALAALVAFCRAHAVPMIDCQQRTEHLVSLGGAEMDRVEFERLLTPRVGEPAIPDWTYDPQLWRQLGIGGASPQDNGT
jgi:leucyl/phenylalanyl-tRNA---protein transferase